MLDLGYSRYAALRGPFRSGLLFLFHLAWKSRIRLPVLIAIGFMVLDIRMQLEINIDLGRGRRQLPRQIDDENFHHGVIDLNETDSELGETSYEGSETESYSSDSNTYSYSGCASDVDEDENEAEDRNDNLFNPSCSSVCSGEETQFSRKN